MTDEDLRQAQALCLQLLVANTAYATQLATLSEALERIVQGASAPTSAVATAGTGGASTLDAWQKILTLVQPGALAARSAAAPPPTDVSVRSEAALAAINEILKDVNTRITTARTEFNKFQTPQFGPQFNPQAEIGRQINYDRYLIGLFQDGISRLEGWLPEAKTLFDAQTPRPQETLNVNLADYRKSLAIVTEGLSRTVATGAQMGAISAKAAQDILQSMNRTHQGWTSTFNASNAAFSDYLKS